LDEAGGIRAKIEPWITADGRERMICAGSAVRRSSVEERPLKGRVGMVSKEPL
jgi:hypothetical protein